MAEVKALHAEVRQADGLTFIARGASNHWVTIDTSEAEGGHAAGSGPMELLLMALGACTSMHVAGTLGKMKQPFSGYRVELSGERQEELPHRFTRIFVDYFVTSDTVPAADVERAIRLSAEKYCSVGGTLTPCVTIVHRYHIIRSSGEETAEVITTGA